MARMHNIVVVLATAAQMWCLGRFLPLLIGHLVPEGHLLLDNFLQLLTIMDYVFAPCTTADKADFVAMLVEDFLTDFKDLYPERRLIPKMHYMVHLPSFMKRYVFLMQTTPMYVFMKHLLEADIISTSHSFTRCGPLIRTWCMRYEAKHSYFKHLARVLGNFKNIAKTLADHHQLFMCYQMCDPSSYLRNNPEYTGGNIPYMVYIKYHCFSVVM